MSEFHFPQLSAVVGAQPVQPKPREEVSPQAWVAALQKQPVAPKAEVQTGWAPPPLSQVETPKPERVAAKVVAGPDPEEVRAQAHEEGFQSGYAEGHAAGLERGLAEGRLLGRDEGRAEILTAEREALEAFRQALAEVVAQVAPAVEAWQHTTETRAAELTMSAVRKLLASELSTGREAAIGIVREALGYVDAPRAVVRLSPFDRASLAERKDEILASCVGIRDLELVDDASIKGGCIVETENGVIDARLISRVRQMESGLEAA